MSTHSLKRLSRVRACALVLRARVRGLRARSLTPRLAAGWRGPAPAAAARPRPDDPGETQAAAGEGLAAALR